MIHRDFVRHLRGNPTDAERLLWRHLRLRQMQGYKFRRQHPVDDYIVDFACVERKLAIELDGGQHAEKKDYDIHRTNILKAHGYQVLRFWNIDLFTNLEEVLTKILAPLESLDER